LDLGWPSLILSLQNEVIKDLKDLLFGDPDAKESDDTCGNNVWPSTQWIHHVYEHTAVGSPLRAFTVEYCATLDKEDFAANAENFPHDMLIELASFCVAALPAKDVCRKERYLVPEGDDEKERLSLEAKGEGT